MAAACKACADPLVITIDPEDSDSGSEPQTVPDDLLLPCGCHFHWQCLLDQAAQVAVSLKCPCCETYLPANPSGPSVTNTFLAAPQATTIPTRYINEGGVQDSLDIMPMLTEEAYLSAHPEARPARALHVMCAEGDVAGIVELLRDVEDDGEMDAAALLRYQDPLAGMRGGLHLAVERRQEEVFWLLLWLASALPSDVFPEAAAQAARGAGVPRGQLRPGMEDVRFLKDERGRTAGEYCAEAGGHWQALVEGGLFAQ